MTPSYSHMNAECPEVESGGYLVIHTRPFPASDSTSREHWCHEMPYSTERVLYFPHLAENGVLAIEVCVRLIRDEELAAARKGSREEGEEGSGASA